MLSRLFMAFLAVSFVAACSSTADDEMAVTMDDSAMLDTSAEFEGDTMPYDRVSVGQAGLDSLGVDGQNAGMNTYGLSAQDALNQVAGDRVFYGYDSSELTNEARQVLQAQVGWLQNNPSIRVIIEGHADERGTREYNLALGERRANAARSYMISLGIAPDRIRTISYGKERPAVLGSDPAAWAKNRRAVTIVE